MSAEDQVRSKPRVAVMADVDSIARSLLMDVLLPAGIEATVGIDENQGADVLLIDVTQLRGDPLTRLRRRRESGDETPAIVLAAHFPVSYMRSLLQLGVRDFILKPYLTNDIVNSIHEIVAHDHGDSSTEGKQPDRLERQGSGGVRAEEIRMLCEIGRAVASVDDLDAVLARVVEAATFLTEAEEANIYLVEEETNEVVLRASKQANDRNATLERLRITDTVAGQVFRSGKPVVFQPYLSGSPVKVQTGFLVQSLIKTPLRVRDQVVGVLGVYNRMTPRNFTDNHLILLQTLADWAGVALERASILAEMRASADGNDHQADVSHDLIDMISDTAESLRSILEGGSDSLSDRHQKELQRLQDRLEMLQSWPQLASLSHPVQDYPDLGAILRQVADKAREHPTTTGLEIVSDHLDEVPLVTGDPEKIRLVLETILMTMVRRTMEGSISLQTRQFDVSKGWSPRVSFPEEVTLTDGVWVAATISNANARLPTDVLIALTGAHPDSFGEVPVAEGRAGDVRPLVKQLRAVTWAERTSKGTKITFALPASGMELQDDHSTRLG